jgi:hypothetical protein
MRTVQFFGERTEVRAMRDAPRPNDCPGRRSCGRPGSLPLRHAETTAHDEGEKRTRAASVGGGTVSIWRTGRRLARWTEVRFAEEGRRLARSRARGPEEPAENPEIPTFSPSVAAPFPSHARRLGRIAYQCEERAARLRSSPAPISGAVASDATAIQPTATDITNIVVARV